MADAELMLEEDARLIVRLLAALSTMDGDLPVKRRALMGGLARLIDADAWSWIISRAADDNDNPAVAAFLHDGMNERQFACYAKVMQDRTHTPVEYAALNELRRTKDHFTRTWDQMVKPEVWYGPDNRWLLEGVGFEHLLYTVRVLDKDGLFSGICLKRRVGRQNFTPRQRRIAHIVSGEVTWLHYNENLANATHEVTLLSPMLRTVLTLLVDGKSIKEIANTLHRSHHTINDHVKELYRRLKVRTRAELLRRFMWGDGQDAQ